ncbi:MAG TPA: MucR family transcriptional regulator, partial [Methylomirabilota bacterium]|nr:MucR family transcriptional regulator [Methylomirabilota bacterium]
SAIARSGEEPDMPALHGHSIPAPTPGAIVLPGRVLGLDDGASRGIALRPLPRRSPLALLRADPRQAVEHDLIRCLVCGSAFRQLTNTHLRNHGMTADEYKRQFGYNRGRPLMCHALQRLYTERAVKIGLAARIRERPILARPELRRQGGARTIALEEILTRREVRERGRPSSY